MNVKLLTEHHLDFLSLKDGCPGSSESTHVKMQHCWKSHALDYYVNMDCFMVFEPWHLYLFRSEGLSLNAGQIVLQNAPREHSAILSTFIKLPFVFKAFVLSIFEWPLKTGYTLLRKYLL